MTQAIRYVMLDRDGVINEDSDDYIKSAEEWLPCPGSLEAIALLNQQDYRVVVISNQSGVGRGLFDQATLDLIHAKMLRLATCKDAVIESLYICPHSPEDRCECRKPKPGLLLQFATEKQVDLSQTYFVGDSVRDIEAAQVVNAKPILVKTGKGKRTLAQYPNLSVPVVENLYEAAQFILSQ